MKSIKHLMFGNLFTASWWRLLKSVAFIICGSYLGLLAIIYFMQTNLVYFPSTEVSATPADLGLAYDELWLTTQDQGLVNGWLIPALNSPSAPPRWVVFCHGNAGNIGDLLPIIDHLHQLGFSTLVFDYRGFGQSPGKPSEKSTYLDALAAWEWLVEEHQVDPADIMVFGRSLGGPVAAWLAAAKNPGMLTIESSFTSMTDMGRRFYPYLPIRLLVRHRYPTKRYVAAYTGPTLILHSEDDELVPVTMGRELFEAATGPRKFIELQGGHNDAWLIMGNRYPKLLQQAVSELWNADSQATNPILQGQKNWLFLTLSGLLIVLSRQ